MATAPKSESKPKANRRSGRTKGYRGQKGGAHQVAWDQDPIILGRIQAGIRPWAQRKGPMECLAVVNAWLAEAHPTEAPIALRTMYEDRDRAAELVARKAQDATGEHLVEYDHLIQRAWEAFDGAKDTSLNRSAILSTIASTIEKKAKLDGSQIDRHQVKGQLGLSVDHEADRLVAVLEKVLPDADAVDRALELLAAGGEAGAEPEAGQALSA